MFCKYCGKKIDKGVKTCPFCGQENGPLGNGVGFFDLAGISASDSSSQPPILSDTKNDERMDQTLRKLERTVRRNTVCALFAIVLSVGLFIVGAIIAQNNKGASNSYITRLDLNSAEKRLTDKISDIEERLGSIEAISEEVDSEGEAENDENDNTEIVIVHNPEDTDQIFQSVIPQGNETVKSQPDFRVVHQENNIVSKEEGTTAILYIEVDKVGLEFRWEKYDENADDENEPWIEITESEGKIQVVSYNKRSELKIFRFGDQYVGVYRCVVFDPEFPECELKSTEMELVMKNSHYEYSQNNPNPFQPSWSYERG